jgi:NAD(P)-dependent dehydrogenase (short-subunit alcohol dehydrogenase family)
VKKYTKKRYTKMERKSVLVTGATVNTGLAIAERFLKEGWAVFITSRNEKEAVDKAAELEKKYATPCFGLKYVPLYAREEGEGIIDFMLERGYCPDCVVCNAANLGLDQNALTCELKDWEDVILTNVMGYFVPARAAANAMIKAGKSDKCSVVFIGSINAMNTIPGRSAYTASKGAILSMTKGLALDFAPHGIRVNCVMPGPIWTTRYDANPEQAARKAAAVPIGRVSTTAEIASAVWFFATEASGNTTGSGLVVDGGLTSIVNGAY